MPSAVMPPGAVIAQQEAAEAASGFFLETVPAVAFTGLRILLIVVLAYLVNRLVRRLIKRLLKSMEAEGVERLSKLRSRAPLADTRPVNLARATMRTETIGGVLRSVTTFAIWTLAVLMILGELGVNLGPLIAGAGIVGVALGFGAQQLVQDFLSGIFMLLEDQYGLGDYINVGEAEGTVEGISLRVTRLRDVYGIVWHVPNGEIRRVGNHSQQWARALLDVGIAYGSDVDLASEIMQREAERLADEARWGYLVLEAPELWGVQELAENQVTIRLVLKVVPLRQWEVMRELRRRIKLAFDEAGVEIPFPQRTIWHRGEQPVGSGDGSAIWERS